VVPLLALGWVADAYVLPAVSDGDSTLALVGAFVSIAVLSLASFFTLRRSTRSSLARIDADNRRLQGLLDAARGLAGVEHAGEAGEAAARAALVLCRADAAFVLVRGEPGAAPVRLAAAGDDAAQLEATFVEPLVELAKLVMSDGRPASAGADAHTGAPAMIAAPLPGEGAPCGALLAARVKDAEPFAPEALDALATLAGLTAVTIHNSDLRDAQRNFFTHVTDILVSALDSHLGYHAGHGQRVAQYANRIGRKLGLDERRLQRLHFAALLHDIGMLKLERHVQMDRKRAARHALLGGRMLSHIKVWEDLAPIVHHHHEWWDGSGYPDGISANEIPLESRIIALSDAFDSMTSATSYKDARSFEAALRELEGCAGTQFDPDVVRAFLDLARSGEVSPEPRT
jgi:hypothetical protein